MGQCKLWDDSVEGSQVGLQSMPCHNKIPFHACRWSHPLLILSVLLCFVAYHRLHSSSLVNVQLLLTVPVGLWNYNILLKERASKISGMACGSKIFYLMSLSLHIYPVTTGTVIIIAITCVNYTLNHLWQVYLVPLVSLSPQNWGKQYWMIVWTLDPRYSLQLQGMMALWINGQSDLGAESKRWFKFTIKK